MQRDNERHHSFDEWEFACEARSIATRLVEKTLSLRVPDMLISEPSQKSAPSNFAHSKERLPSKRPVQGCDQTLAPSYESSEISSMLRLSMRIKEKPRSKTTSPKVPNEAWFRIPDHAISTDDLSENFSSMNLSMDRSSQPVANAMSVSSLTDERLEDAIRAQEGYYHLGAELEDEDFVCKNLGRQGFAADISI
jgi:hypothetical protein